LLASYSILATLFFIHWAFSTASKKTKSVFL
jgi:hypothetical protein